MTCSPEWTFPGTGDAGNCWQVDCGVDNSDSLASGMQSFLEQFPLREGVEKRVLLQEAPCLLPRKPGAKTRPRAVLSADRELPGAWTQEMWDKRTALPH